MKHTYSISGMTCEGCRDSVTKKIQSVEGVSSVEVSLEDHQATIQSTEFIPLEKFQSVLKPAYVIFDPAVARFTDSIQVEERSKMAQLKPLFLILAGIWIISLLLNVKTLNAGSIMFDYMGLFFLVFAGFKLADYKGFPPVFGMYDPLAKAIPTYGWIYPFIEIALGLMFLARYQTQIALWVTVVVLGITTVGVVRSLLSKKQIKCACLGTALNLPMTEATFVENAIMLAMATLMLTQTFT
ncbi:heavy-metal-associated domain-containing protein [Aureitalea marina]|uniref:Heavy metal transporter n=1 Tax=Aureitalea marina TaxID=930804 RepID=A0A2S7KLT0_9FLAO|nr:heavy-metal-associated domain-containing protein [Aureitalea marina]PQB03585.1 heavy metal transporter [Aureitalea marina]